MASLTREEYIKLQNETIEKSRQIYTKAISYCPSVFDAETYPAFLSFLAKWNHYSILNVILLYMQNPDIKYIGTFQTWKMLASEQGYSENYIILPKEQRGKGLTLLAPFSFNKDEGSHTLMEERFATYKAVHVFDVSQVNDIQSPKVFSPYVPIGNLDFSHFLSMCRSQFQEDLRFMPGSPEDKHFSFSAAYLKGDTVIYLASAPDQKKKSAILKEIIRFYSYRTCEDKKEREYVFLSIVYSVFDFFCIDAEKPSFASISVCKDLGQAYLFRMLHYICSLTQFFIHEFYCSYQQYSDKFSDGEHAEIIKLYGL